MGTTLGFCRNKNGKCLGTTRWIRRKHPFFKHSKHRESQQPSRKNLPNILNHDFLIIPHGFSPCSNCFQFAFSNKLHSSVNTCMRFATFHMKLHRPARVKHKLSEIHLHMIYCYLHAFMQVVYGHLMPYTNK